MRKLFYLFLCLLMAGTAMNVHAQCNAAFGWQANPNGNNLLNVDFYNNSTAGSNPGATTYSYCTIDYGDGMGNLNFGFGSPSSSHNYANPGSYTVTVTIHTYDSSFSGGGSNVCNDTETSVVTIAYSPCAASITTLNNGNGQYNFTANNPANTSGINYTWDFGDGSATTTGLSVSHTYSTGNYTVTLTSSGGGCTYTNTSTINYIQPAPFDCSSASADFSSSISNSDVNFTNLSSGNQNFATIYLEGNWDFGDGTTTTASGSLSHSYTAVGTYTVTLANTWRDSLSNQIVCTKTISHNVTINSLTPPPPPLNQISGIVTFDTLSNIPWSDSIKVWLIMHDATANTLSAVDSQYVSPYYAFYMFNDKPAGDYLVKAAFISQAIGSVGYVPTYHLASVYWNSATNIAHAAGMDVNKDIHLQNGMVTSGPGFIGGNISMGAGRGTNTGIPGLLVYLRGANNQLISSTLTDENGDYSFSNIAMGTYSIYPEAMNYTTTPYNSIVVSGTQPQVPAIDFEQQNNLIFPKGTRTSVSNITAKDGLNIYPNPAKDVLVIENQNGLFNQGKIVNAMGQLIKEVSLKNGINKVDITALDAGVYYLLINGNGGSRSMKMVKQ